MPREPLARTLGDVPGRVNQPGMERGKQEHPPETILNKVTVVEGPPGVDGADGRDGADGVNGADGAPGADGDPGVVSYRHVQSIAAAVWTVTHNLGYFPGGVLVEDSDHNAISGRVAHVDGNTLTISFFVNGAPAATGGEAYIS